MEEFIEGTHTFTVDMSEYIYWDKFQSYNFWARWVDEQR